MANPSVLIVDDELVVRESIAEDLKREGFDLWFAENGEEALSLVHMAPPSVIILDLRMPVMDGIEFLDKVDLRPSDPYTVIVLTGHGDEAALKRCYDAGVRTFLKKPFNLFEVRGVVKNAVALQEFTNRLEELVQERTAQLEQRVREMALIHDMIKKQLADRSEVAQAYKEAYQDFQKLSGEMSQLATRLGSLPPPDPLDFSGNS